MIQNLEEINKELKIAHDKRKEEKKKEYDARNLITPNEKRNARIVKLKTKHERSRSHRLKMKCEPGHWAVRFVLERRPRSCHRFPRTIRNRSAAN